MRKDILAIVLALFLGGCSAIMAGDMAGKSFDHSLMKKADQAVSDIVTAANMAKGVKNPNLRPTIDLAWAKYYAGNVALAEGNTEKATAYLEETIALVEKAAEILIKHYRNLSPEFPSLLKGGAFL